MQTKSRYEVISDLESQKRQLIKDKEGLTRELLVKENELKIAERNKEDMNRAIERQIADKKEEIKQFKDSIKSRELTIDTLIKSVDDSLVRFNKIAKE